MQCSLNHRAALTLALLLASGPALAICLPFQGHIRVGADPVHCQANDIQSAINLAGVCPVTIDITREHTYTNQQLTIGNKYITFQGWGDGVTCADIPNEPAYAPPASNVPLVTIDGSGNGRVLTINGNNNVGLHNLTITGGQIDDSSSGGGISFDGGGSLYLINSTINLNHGGYGGGINVNGSSGLTSLYLMDHTQILVNTAAVSGGGVRIEGNTRLYALEHFTLIGFNHAPNGYGGGLEVLGPARADIGSPGYNGLAVVYNNTAQNGGGIAALARRDGSGDAAVRLFTTDPANPVQLADNIASMRGGAIYLKPFTQKVPAEEGSAMACAFDFRINDNIAADGAAVYADFDSDISGRNVGSAFELNQADECGPERPSALGAVACGPGVACNEIARNIAADDNNQPTGGAVIAVDSTSSFFANRLNFVGNAAAYGINAVGADENNYGQIAIANCLFADNHTQHELVGVRRTESTSFSIGRCTFANDTIDNGYALYGNQNTIFSLANSIIALPGSSTLDFTGTPDHLNLGYLLSNDSSTLGSGVGVVQGMPTFVDAAHGNYHLQLSSLGVDFAPAVGGLDLDRQPRTVDLPGVANQFGPLDLGAYEIQPACSTGDTIFCNGFDG